MIAWLCILPSTGSPPNDNHRKGYGTKMLAMFQEYIMTTQPFVKALVLIPEHFDGINKNNLCTFYEKSGFVHERPSFPTYIKYI
jgi:hypothetical protein